MRRGGFEWDVRAYPITPTARMDGPDHARYFPTSGFMRAEVTREREPSGALK